MRMDEFDWYRKIQTTVVGHALLPSADVHTALVEYLVSVRAKIYVGVVEKILTVTSKDATNITKRLGCTQVNDIVMERRCQHITVHPNVKCKMMVKILRGDISSACLCRFHIHPSK